MRIYNLSGIQNHDMMINKLILSLVFLCFSITIATAQTNDFLSSKFHKERRQALRQMMPKKSVVVVFSNPVRNRANDVDYVYHQDPNFYYLTGLKEPDAVLLIFKEPQTIQGKSTDEIIYVRQKNALRELYEGERLGKTYLILL